MWNFLDKNFIGLSNILFCFLAWGILSVPIYVDEFEIVRGMEILTKSFLYNCTPLLLFCFLCVFFISFLTCYSFIQKRECIKKETLKKVITLIFMEMFSYFWVGVKMARELKGITYSPYILILIMPLCGYLYVIRKE